MEMCRFSGLQDAEYKKVASALSRIVGIVKSRTLASETSSSRCNDEGIPPPNPYSALNEEEWEQLLDSLKFSQLDTRHASIKAHHSKTCRWLLSKSEYRDWRDPSKQSEHNGFLWIKGKPGAGKSTIMKFAFANARIGFPGVVISFFFNARGEYLEKS